MVTRKRVVLGVSGGIAAYKACSLLRLFTESGHDVTVVPTAAALNFVGTATWAALSGNPVSTEVWTDVHQVPHVRLGQHADLVVVAPATADLMAKAAHGLADDLLTNTLLTARCPVVLAPAMHTEMWEHPATVALPGPEGVTLVPVQTAVELGEAVAKAAQDCDVVVMAAAVADYRPAHYTDVKIKKSHGETLPESQPLATTIELVRNPDVLSGLVQSRGTSTAPVLVGFAAETGDPEHTVLDLARDKFVRKGCDVLVANEVGVDKTFGQDTNTVHILRRGVDVVTHAGPAPKDIVAAAVWDVIQDVLSSG